MNRRTHALVLLAVLAASGCGGGAYKARSAAPQAVNDGGRVDATRHATVDVTASDFRFSPSAIVAAPGEVLTLVVHNASSTEHNLTQKAQGVDVDLKDGATRTVTLTVPSSGLLVFVCEYHASRGMAGTVGAPGAAAPSSGASPTAPGDRGNGY